MQPKRLMIDRVKGHTFLKNYLHRNGVIIDLGMNKGDFARTMRARYGCSIIGVEANPVLASQNRDLNGITCRNAAMAGCDGSVRFLINEENSEASSIVADETPISSTVITIPSISLSTLFREAKAEQIDLLKIDIEGAELDVIETTDPEVLRQCAQIAVEFHAFIYPSHTERIEKIIALLASLGFYHIDFSTEKNDVLFINSNVFDLNSTAKASLLLQKYRAGIGRLLLRWAITAKIVAAR